MSIDGRSKRREAASIATIGYCLVQLPILPLLLMRLRLASTLCTVAVGLALVFLTMYARLILPLLVPEAERRE